MHLHSPIDGRGIWAESVPPLSEENYDQFDIASCQFALHYMFQSEERAHHFFSELSMYLKEGGEFIATTMDCRVIAEELLKQLHGPYDADNDDVAGISLNIATGEDVFDKINQLANQDEEKTITIRNDVEYSVLKIKFEDEMYKRLINLAVVSNTSEEDQADESKDIFGIQYKFTLQDNKEGAAVDAPEWIVPLGDPLLKLVAAHGLKLIEVKNFQEIMSEMMQSSPKLEKYIFI